MRKKENIIENIILDFLVGFGLPILLISLLILLGGNWAYSVGIGLLITCTVINGITLINIEKYTKRLI